MHIKNVNKHVNSFHLQLRTTQFEKWGDGSSVHKPLSKQSQEGCNLFLRLRCELIWISQEDTVSGPRER